jgi:hypothetical protein
VRAVLQRVGLFRLAAALVGGALVLEVLRNAVLPATRTTDLLCTAGEVLFVAAAAAVFLLARRARVSPRRRP